MKNLLIAFAFFLPATSFCQYYYNDILDARVTGERMKTYIDQKVKTITATGFDGSGAKTSDFNEWQEINAANRTLKITTRNGQLVGRQYYQFDSQFRLTGITDSSVDIKSTTAYSYNNSGNLLSVKTTTKDSLQDFSETEDHQYVYGPSGKLDRLWRIVNEKDSSEYRLSSEGSNNITGEQLFRRGTGLDAVYYYYDDNNRLTDIVRYNKKLKKLLPDLMLEYDESNRIIQKMTTISLNNPDYLLWRYLYNEKGLKTKEVLFNKKKEVTGRIEYAYTYQ